MAKPISVLLSSRAAEFSEDIFKLWREGHLESSELSRKVAHDIATGLHLINRYLVPLPPYWLDLELEQLCHKVLHDLESITQPPIESAWSALSTRRSSFTSLFTQNSHVDQETCFLYFFKKQKEKAVALKIACDDLIYKLTGKDHRTEKLPDFARLHLDIPPTLDEYSDDIFRALQLIAQCEPSSHETDGKAVPSKLVSQVIRHPVRLCLHELPNAVDPASHGILILVSAIDMTLWQEFCLNIQPKGLTGDNQRLLSRGGFCPLLEEDVAARLFLSFDHDKNINFFERKTELSSQIFQGGPGESLNSILCHYDLAPKDKVMLAHAIARSYWQYYDSELMRTKWTSDTIWFMPEDDNGKQKGQLPLCAYLSFPFDVSDNIMPDIIYEGLLNHRCPRIFDIGILLLEVGLGRPFSRICGRDTDGQANLNHKLATDQLFELQTMEWDDFTNKHYFDLTVDFCLNSDNFMPPSKQLKPVPGESKLSTERTAASDWRQGISTRKKTFYQNVVRPLEWLAKRDCKAQVGDITYVSKKPDSSLLGGISDTIAQPEPGAFFHSGIDARMWLQDLKKISEQVEYKRRRCNVFAPVRIAILDTGINKDFFAFKTKKLLLESIVDEKDFVDPSATKMRDTFGHGTFMARLIIECAPGAEIMVVRVAENTKKLKDSRKNIKEAIFWLGRTGKADIISMSFGFPDDDQGIREAIETVQNERQESVIFLASAGNSSTDNESFPARHPSVISVYATDRYGDFLRSNSASTTNGAAVLGTYGDDIPDYIREEFGTSYPDVCQPGCSVATAIMAGISATMLIYTTILPSLVLLQGESANIAFQRLRTTKGLEKILCRLVQRNPEHPRLMAVKPAWFWKSRSNDIDRYMAICEALADLHGSL